MTHLFFSTGRRAFSLLELLVVIGLIGGLASFLLPTLVRAKDHAHRIECLGNLRQWGLAFRLYADDNQDFLPRRGQGVQSLALITRMDDWFNALPPYLNSLSYQQLVADGRRPAPGDRSVFVCPDATDPGATNFLAYGMNMNLSTWNNPLPARFGEIQQPDLEVALADAPGPYASTYPSAQSYDVMARHGGSANVLFLAGEAKSFTGDYLGCGIGDPGRLDIHWLTGMSSDALAHNY